MKHDVSDLVTNLECPQCGVGLNGATNVDGSQQFPQIGDITVCSYCLSYLEFSADCFVHLSVADARNRLDSEQFGILQAIRLSSHLGITLV